MRSALVSIVLLVAACQGDRVKCEKGIRHYAELVYWEQADVEIAAAPPEKRESLRQEKLAKFKHDMERGLDVVISKCTTANSDAELDCMLAAKTAKQAKDCGGD